MAQSPAGVNILSNTVQINPATISSDASGRLRVSWLTTLFDGKTLNADNTFVWDNKWTGTGTRGNNLYDMSVTSGQYLIRQSKRYSPYFSGKSQFVEITCDNFESEANVTKRVCKLIYLY